MSILSKTTIFYPIFHQNTTVTTLFALTHLSKSSHPLFPPLCSHGFFLSGLPALKGTRYHWLILIHGYNMKAEYYFLVSSQHHCFIVQHHATRRQLHVTQAFDRVLTKSRIIIQHTSKCYISVA